jgi:multidrug efflux pump subunit AcrA (membrane-fusion protein)
MGGWVKYRAVPLLLLLLTCCGGDTAIEPQEGAPARRAVVTRGTFQASVLLTGELQAVESAKLVVPRTPMWRMPIRWMEEDGALVIAGQKVIELDNSQFTGELEQNRIAESRAHNDLLRKEADIAIDLADREYRLAQARTQHERAAIEAAVPEEIRSRREHQEKQLALSKAEVELQKAIDDLETGREAAVAELEELRIALEEASREVRVADEAIAQLTLRAPRDGIFVISESRREGRKYEVGDDVWVGLPVASIPELEEMQVEARLSDVDDRKIAVGMKTVCVLDAYPAESFEGEVVEIAPVAKGRGRESRRRSFNVVIRLHHSDPEKMRPGMSVRAEVLPPPREDVLLAPRFSFDFNPEMPRALLADGSSREVVMGPCNTLDCVVEEGLNEGEELWSGG